MFYTDDRCGHVLTTSDRRNQCIGFINIGQSYAGSFVCVSFKLVWFLVW